MDKEKYFDDLVEEVGACLLEESEKHAVLIVFDSSNGQVKTYSINADYDTAQMLVGTAAAFIVGHTGTERTIN